MSERLQITDVLAADLPDWRMIHQVLFVVYRTGSFAAGLKLVERIAEAAESANHHPDLTLTYPQVVVTLWSHDVGGVTDRDVALARTISTLAATAGHAADTSHTVVDDSNAPAFWVLADADGNRFCVCTNLQR